MKKYRVDVYTPINRETAKTSFKESFEIEAEDASVADRKAYDILTEKGYDPFDLFFGMRNITEIA